MRCFAHSLNLVITDAIKSVKELPPLIQKVKSVVTFFRASINASDELRKYKDLKLIQDVLTRWNSTFYMLERFLNLRQFISTVLINFPKGPPILTAPEIETLTQVLKVLRPLESMTREISGEKYVTSSKVISMIGLLIRQYDRLITTQELAIELKTCVVKECKQRWGKVEYNQFCQWQLF